MITMTEMVVVMTPRINIRDYRCQSCGRLLFRAHIPRVPGLRIEIRCPRCSRTDIIESDKETQGELYVTK
jgi:phage FluMu protein Com